DRSRCGGGGRGSRVSGGGGEGGKARRPLGGGRGRGGSFLFSPPGSRPGQRGAWLWPTPPTHGDAVPALPRACPGPFRLGRGPRDRGRLLLRSLGRLRRLLALRKEGFGRRSGWHPRRAHRLVRRTDRLDSGCFLPGCTW